MTRTSTSRSFSAEKADQAERFFLKLAHVKGQWSGSRFELRPWQRDDIIRPLFGTVLKDGRRQYRTALIGVPRKNGKGLDVSTPILTDFGWSTMGALEPGDQVHAPDGSLAVVDWVSERHRLPCWRVRFADGAELIADEDHEWVVNDRHRGRRVISTPELHRVQRYGARGDRRFTVDVPAPLERPSADLLLDPYLLGTWLGDGTTFKAAVTSADPAIFDAWERAGFALSYAYERGLAVTRGILRLKMVLQELEVLGNKHVPLPYLEASEAQRFALLQGLMDTDGSVIRGPNTPRVEFCTTSERLAADVLFLARSLGWKATSKEGRAVLEGRDCGPRWRVCWTAWRDRPPFVLARKAELLALPNGATRSHTNAIVAVDEVPSRETVCIAVDHPSHQFLAGRGLTPTHNSTLGAGIALKLLFADQEPGSEVYSAAADRDQAAIVFDMARTMVESSPQLARRAKVYRRAIEVPHTGSIYKVLSAEAYSKHGSSPHGVIFDELHAQPSRELWDVLTTGQGARRQPLTVAITTAGYDRANICYELYEYGQRLQSRQIDDPTFFFRWWGAELTDDWEDEKVWARVNPNLGISPSIDFLRAEMRQAKQNPARQNTVRRLFLNQWTLAASRWFDLGLWDENAGLVVEEKLEGRLCYGGLDLASTSDFTAWVLFFPPEPGKEEEGAQVLARFWLPRAAVERRTPMREQLAVWEREGWLKVTEGNVIDEAAIEAQIDADAQRFNVRSVNYDRWGSRQLIRRLEDAGMPCEGVAQTASHLNAPSLEVERLLGLGQLHHGGNPVLRWQADSVQVAIDSSGAIKPDRKKSTERIDGIAALVDAIHGYLDQQDEGVTAFIAG